MYLANIDGDRVVPHGKVLHRAGGHTLLPLDACVIGVCRLSDVKNSDPSVYNNKWDESTH